MAVSTAKGSEFPADVVLFNLPPWDAAALFDETPRRAGRETPPVDGWGAFMVYAGVDDSVMPSDAPLHSQVLVREPYEEGNSVFISLSLADDSLRAPRGRAQSRSARTPGWNPGGDCTRVIMQPMRRASRNTPNECWTLPKLPCRACGARRPTGDSGHAGQLPALYAPERGLGGRLSADEPDAKPQPPAWAGTLAGR